ncbi:MAG TPA: hypothetical protein VIG62_01670 [Blastocatellia bacterium]
MRRAAITTLLPSARAFIVFVALATLCISESVGLQLLPMPGGARITPAAESSTTTPAPGSSSLRWPSREVAPRVEMRTPEIDRAIIDPNANQSDSACLPVVATLNCETSQSSHKATACFAHRTFYFFDTAGRAPPHRS